MISKQEHVYLYEDINENEARLLRVFGAYPQVQIPEEIDGKCITVIGAYCFAENSRLTKEQEQECAEYLAAQGIADEVRPLAGKYMVSISLPDTIKCLESYAFYNCSELEQISVGPQLMEVNGDSFMNCRKLRKLVMRCGMEQTTGLPFILNQITSEIEVSFIKPEMLEEKLNQDEITKTTLDKPAYVQLRLVYPEYTESYEEIGPAHIFRLQVEGQGFRARKQFQNGVVDLNGYDQVFEMARSLESVATLSQMALDRLVYPVDLKEEYRIQYEEYLSENEDQLMKLLVKEQEMEPLQFVCESGFVSNRAMEQAIQQASMQGWTKGSAAMIRWKNAARKVESFQQAGADKLSKEIDDEYVF